MRGKTSYEIVVAEPYSPEAISRLEQIGKVKVLLDAAPETLMAALTTADALLVRSKAHVTARIIDAAPNLKVIGRASSTADHIDLRAARRRNIHVVYAPQVAVTSTAEFTLSLIIALHRRLLFLDRQLREGQFDALRAPVGREMSRETLGLWGLDPIAERLGKLCTAAFGQE
jgi:D-3-phosphoglycerate dehydrogenase